MIDLLRILAILGCIALARAHSVITYPLWRGNNLHTNGSNPVFAPENIGIEQFGNDSHGFPYGMQWMYPCGGMPLSTNRTKWPVTGGAVSIQPGWFPGHLKAFFYVNIGITPPGGLNPPNMSHPVVPPFQILGPTNDEYNGQFCLPQVPMPVNVTLGVGDNITIQVVETAQHGAALYNCADVTLAAVDDPEIPRVTPQNCYNSSDIGFELVFTTAALTNAGSSIARSPSFLPLIAIALTAVAASWL